MKRVIIVAGVLLLVGTGAWYLFYGQKSEVQQAPQASSKTSPTQIEGADTKLNKNSITYTSSGFSPSTLTVKAGSTVTFLNNSNEEMWVASKPHPIHTNLPGFDAKKGYGPSESYSFTFSEPGSFGFHNHLSPSQEGTIVVE